MRRHRLRLVVWVVLIVGLPLAILLQLALGERDYGAPIGEQPGGELRARVVDADGTPVVEHPVELQVWAAGALPQTHATQASDSQGRVVFQAPPVLGKYRLVAGGGALQRVGRECSFVDSAGGAVEVQEAELVLAPGAVIELVFTRLGGIPAGSGQLRLEGQTLDGALFGLLTAPVGMTRDFDAGRCVLDGLPPLSGQVSVHFTDGTELSFEVRAPAGTTSVAYEL